MSKKIFRSHKLVTATPMNRLEYNQYRGWELPEDENGVDEGYLVEYLDGGQSNHPGHEGYISWSPKEQFDNGYSEVEGTTCRLGLLSGLTFGIALEQVKQGKKIARIGWNGKGQYVFFEESWEEQPLNGNPIKFGSFLGLHNAQGGKQYGWVPSQGDLFADDWVVID